MKKRILYLFVLLFFANNAMANVENDSIFQVLQQVLAHKNDYTLDKEGRITDARKMLKIPDLTAVQYYTINKQLYQEYQTYQTDSAIHYLNNNLKIAGKLHSTEYLYETKIELSFMYWQLGEFFEAIDVVESLDRAQFHQLPEVLLRNYFEAYKRLYRYYAQSHVDRNNHYFKLSNAYRDSLLNIVPAESTTQKILMAEKLSDENDTQAAEQILLDLLSHSQTEDRERAIFANILAKIYQKEGNLPLQKKYYAISAICDMKNAVKENSSMQDLALLLYQEGDIDHAYACIHSSMEDAVFCNSRFRTYEITKIFPIIDHAYHAKTVKQEKAMRLYLLLVSILSIILIAAIIYLYRQMKRIAKIRKELYHTNLKLQHLNADLTTVNRKLSETNVIKEAYLGKFIDLCSNYIEKLHNYRRSLNKIAASEKIENLYAALKSTKYIDGELSDFYTNFDETFLRIYPSFIQDFNALFGEEDKQIPKSSELLNTELRIYALIRLGIHDSAKIAGFLRYSITTIYTYRSKLKHKSLFKDDLEDQVMKIGQ